MPFKFSILNIHISTTPPRRHGATVYLKYWQRVVPFEVPLQEGRWLLPAAR
jgi:hypothetical protein